MNIFEGGPAGIREQGFVAAAPPEPPAALPIAALAEKQPRELCEYNRFIREEVKRLKAEQPSLDQRAAFRTASIKVGKCGAQECGPLVWWMEM